MLLVTLFTFNTVIPNTAGRTCMHACERTSPVLAHTHWSHSGVRERGNELLGAPRAL